jgi:hypothetical protein
MIEKSGNIQKGKVLVVWTILLAFLGQALALPAASNPVATIRCPLTISRLCKAKPLPRASYKMAVQAEESPGKSGGPFPVPADTSGFAFHDRVFQLPAANPIYLFIRGASTPLYLRHCLFRI